MDLPRLRELFTDEVVDRALRASIPGGSTAAAWFIPHDNDRARDNIRDVVRIVTVKMLNEMYAKLGIKE